MINPKYEYRNTKQGPNIKSCNDFMKRDDVAQRAKGYNFYPCSPAARDFRFTLTGNREISILKQVGIYHFRVFGFVSNLGFRISSFQPGIIDHILQKPGIGMICMTSGGDHKEGWISILISTLVAAWVSPPTDMRFTPVSARRAIRSRVMPPDTSIKALSPMTATAS